MKKITIRNFGPIQNIEDLEIKDFMVFIGPQASGKSTVAKMVYFFKSVREDVLKYLLGLLEKKSSRTFPAAINVLTVGLEDKFNELLSSKMLQDDTQIDFEYKTDHSISVKKSSLSFSSKVSISLKGRMHTGIQALITKCEKFAVQKGKSSNKFPTQTERIIKEADLESFKEGLANEINIFFGEEEEPLFIPAGRAVLTSLVEHLPFFETGSKMDLLTKDFAKKVLFVRPYFDKKNGELVYENAARLGKNASPEFVKAAQSKIQSILKGEYRRENDEERIYFSQNRYVSIGHASSGQQESLWILMLIFIRILDKSKVFVVVEEPEAHLFPDAQKEIVELIALLCNAQPGNKALITTHSPYILYAVNNFLMAQKVLAAGRSLPPEIPPETALRPEQVAAYRFSSDGKVYDIMDAEVGLIDEDELDRTADELGVTFSSLQDRLDGTE